NIEFDVDSFAIKDKAVESMTDKDKEAARRVYAMVTNIDDNIGKIMQLLHEKNLEENTIVVFLTDNGPQHKRYKLGLRKRKSSVYGGGVRVPCMIRYPKKYPDKQDLDIRLAHIDLLPSILDLCGLNQPDHNIDGRSFEKANGSNFNAFSERTLFFEWGRGFPIKYKNFSALKGDYKLVGNTGSDSEISNFELFNVKSDPFENTNLVDREPEIALDLKVSMDGWYEEIISEKHNNKVFPAYIGSEFENPVVLNRNDAKGTPVAWGQDDILGFWDVKVLDSGNYNVTFQFVNAIKEPGIIHLKLYPQNFVQKNTLVAEKLTLKNIELKQGEFRLEAFY
ncbi:MAG: sulfatase-like hydrolase/transferase, partial [Cyclobacteriaceae bacterium]|nr:sulfatase-like hydrolase/transferase [Cyclobacteriaceae bacterium]